MKKSNFLYLIFLLPSLVFANVEMELRIKENYFGKIKTKYFKIAAGQDRITSLTEHLSSGNFDFKVKKLEGGRTEFDLEMYDVDNGVKSLLGSDKFELGINESAKYLSEDNKGNYLIVTFKPINHL